MKDYLREARELKEQLIAWRRQIHLNPELGMDTPKTAAFISGVLKELGYEPKTLGGGVVATLKGPCPGKTILLRAELDALPMQEESGLPFASQNPGVAHTCGHDTHAAMLLGAAQLLMEHRRELAGSVKLMFEPGEETLEGAWSMLEAGLLTDPPVDACLAIHSLINTPEPTGRLICNPGPVSASCDVFRIEIKGKGTHGSRPETGVDPINILCHLHGLLQTILTREKPQKEPAVLTICQIYAGKADNVIPEEGFMTGTVRTFNREVQMLIRRRMEEIVTGTAQALGGEGRVIFRRSAPPAVNDKALTLALRGYMTELLGEEQITDMGPRLASDDFAAVMAKVPGAKLRLSMGSTAEGYVYDLHNPKARFNEEALPVGAAVYAYGALRWLAEQKK